MSQKQPEKPEDQPAKLAHGDLFSIECKIPEQKQAANSTSADAGALMQAAEAAAGIFRYSPKGAASKIQSIASAHNDFLLGRRTVSTEAIDGDHQGIAALYGRRGSSNPTIESSGSEGFITIGEALEATVLTAGQKPVEWSDAAAIQAAEVRATGRTAIMPGGVAANAQSAATLNARLTRDEDKKKLADVLTGATAKLPADRPATRKDAEGVTGAEMRNDPNLTTHPAGVSAAVAAAARINQSK